MAGGEPKPRPGVPAPAAGVNAGRGPMELPGALAEALGEFLDSLDREGGLSVSTRSSYGRDLQSYLARAATLGARRLPELTAEAAGEHLAGLVQAGRSPATVARAVSSMRRFHEFLQTTGRCPEDPTSGLRAPRVARREPDPLTVEEAERLVNAVRGDDPLELRDRAVLEMLYATGVRVSELTALRTPDLLLDNGLVRVHGRGARERMVPVGRPAAEAAGRYERRGRPRLAGADSADTFFLGVRGRAMTRMSVWKVISTAARVAGIERPVNPQTLRHTFASHLLDGGFDLSDVQHLLGHSDISTTLIYARADEQRLRELHRTFHPRG
ncbi:MAG: tyrosine recombinase [Gemmatimonadaceae bacterium]|nr:tyrosine recombinase [Gemmatimonadaceae bacterium]